MRISVLVILFTMVFTYNLEAQTPGSEFFEYVNVLDNHFVYSAMVMSITEIVVEVQHGVEEVVLHCWVIFGIWEL